ncbi:MAG: TlpA disulfide reductase family protein [Paludibacter sp.]|nr:TlpA disulfide reductase family protein [Paludibacter sp.]
MMKKLAIITVIISTFISCGDHSHLHDGIWRAELALVEKAAPFLIELKYAHTDTAMVVLMNGEERVELKNCVINGDSITIPIEAYDTRIEAVLNNHTLEGLFIKNYIENDPGVPFKAEYGNKQRFEPVSQPSLVKIDGKWEVLFISEEGDTANNVGIFKSEGTTVTGSVLTSFGDLRFLEGNYTENGIQLSAFAGLSPYLLEITFDGNDAFEGILYTTRSKTKMIGKRNEQAGLADPYSLTSMKPGMETLSFSLPNTEGQIISINDERYRDKVLIVSVLGSWCPNCLDEMAFLSPWYSANRDRGVEVVGLAFERKDDFSYAQGTLQRLKQRYNTEYEILFGGQAGRESTGKALPELEKINSYPTTFFIDKKGKVRKIHTGFNGPATGLFYEEFKRDFNSLVDQLVAE